MAITANTVTHVGNQTADATPWEVHAYSADLSNCEVLKAAAAGVTHYLKAITIVTGSNITVTVGSDEATNAVVTAHLGPVPFGSAGGTVTLDFSDRPIQCTAAKALTVDASGGGATYIYAQGYSI